MNRKKGFTLIELLAVIVILAIIALIAVPVVLNIINDARKGAFQRSAEGVLKSAKLSYSTSLFNEEGPSDMMYYCDGTSCLSDKVDENNNQIGLDIDGNTGEGDVFVYSDGSISLKLTNGSFCAVKYLESTKITVTEGNCDNIDVSNDDTPPVIDSVATTVTTSSARIVVAASDEQSTIKGYSYSIDGGAFTDISNNRIYDINGLEKGSAHTVVVRVYNKLPDKVGYDEASNMSESQEYSFTILSMAVPTLTATNFTTYTQTKTVTINYEPENVTRSAGVVSSYIIDDGAAVEVSESSTSFDVTDNVTIVVKNVDTNNSDTNNNELSQTYEITTIDRTAPTAVGYTYTRDDDSMTIRATATDAQSGIYSFAYSIDGGANWTEHVVNSSSTNAVVDEFTTSASNNGNYTILVKATNNAYHVGPDSNAETAINLGVTTTAGAGACVLPHFTVTPSGYAQSKTVTIDPVNGYTASYSTDGGTTFAESASGVTLTSNGDVVGMLSDGTNECTAVQAVDGIDTTAPTSITVDTVTPSYNSATIDITVVNDAGGAPLDTPTCVYGLTNSYGSTCQTISNSQITISGLEANQTYHYNICAVDTAGNSTCTGDSTFTTTQLTASLIDYTSQLTVQQAIENLYETFN